MTATGIPRQYAVVVGLLLERSESYSAYLVQALSERGSTISLMATRFEIDTYLVFLLDYSLFLFGHNQEVRQDLIGLCEDALCDGIRHSSLRGTLPTAIRSRLQKYGYCANGSMESGRGFSLDCVEALQQYILASSGRGVEETPPIVIHGELFDLPLVYVPANLHFAAAYVSGIKRICEHSNDIRTLYDRQVLELGYAGIKEEEERHPLGCAPR